MHFPKLVFVKLKQQSLWIKGKIEIEKSRKSVNANAVNGPRNVTLDNSIFDNFNFLF